MERVPYSTIEQWSVLRAVVETGSYVKAAEALHRSQSSVSYAIGQLQKVLDVQLLTIEGRRAVLTEAGRALLNEAIPLIDELRYLESRSRSIAEGKPATIRLVVDYLYPKSLLFEALGRFNSEYPGVDIHLREVVRQPIGSLDGKQFDLAILMMGASTLWSEVLVEAPLITVAHASHPLAKLPGPIAPTLLSRYARIQMQGFEEGGEAIAEEGKIWRMNTVESAIEVIRRGIGFGRIPRHEIEPYLAEGSLVPLDIGPESTRTIPLGLCFSAAGRHVNPTVRALARLLGATLKGF
ncbi:LysR family transcriptional regulator [uncultured Cohaesibacter sp.]|uniref:LysR family transcriptional regulator n=1 Tax=uncultured Cohaesibacter sp. TaxID=1002546 RepID=UPI0029C819C2|nr:LysR family transcriptional regulator [uncultured Cohaesibacter sp.]